MNDDYAYWEMSEELNAVSRKSTTEVTVCIEWEMLQKKKTKQVPTLLLNSSIKTNTAPGLGLFSDCKAGSLFSVLF